LAKIVDPLAYLGDILTYWTERENRSARTR